MTTTDLFYIGGYVDSNCHIQIEDNTTYPFTLGAYGSQSRSKYGIALFWSNDAFVTAYNDLTNSTTGWDTNPSGSGMFEYNAFITRVWTNAQTYATNCITSYGNNFYIATAPIAPSGTDPSVNTNWTLLDSSDPATNYAAFVAAMAAVCTSTGQTLTTVNKTCGDLTFTQTTCLTWTIANTTDADMYVKFTDVAGTAVTVTTDATAAATNIYTVPDADSIEVTLGSTGVYLVEIQHVLDSTDSYKVIFELCSYWACYFGMIKNVLCNDFDPCCEPCDATAQKQDAIYRLQINKMSALINDLKAKVSYDTFAYWNTDQVDTTRTDLLEEVDDVISQLDNIIVRCGLCDGAQSSDVVTPCTSC